MRHRYQILVYAWQAVFLTTLAAQAAPLTTNAAWTWIKGSNLINQPGIYGTQGVADPANLPGARREAITWTGADGTFWLLGGWGLANNSGYLNDLWQCDPATTNWTWIRGSSNINQYAVYGTWAVEDAYNIPGARCGAAAWTDASGALWLFGGYGYAAAGDSGHLNDLWRFNPNTWNWTWVKGLAGTNSNGTYGYQGEPRDINTPGARVGAAACKDASGALWLFGGWGYDCFGDEGALNDLWKFDPATSNWTWMKGANLINQNGTYYMSDAENTPGARSGAALWADDSGALWLFGGWGYPAAGGPSLLNDLWCFSPATTNWYFTKGNSVVNQPGIYGTSGVPAQVNKVGARQLFGLQKDAYNSVLLFGGWGYAAAGEAGQLNDLWQLDRANIAWAWMKGSDATNQSGVYGVRGVPARANTPGARAYSVSWMSISGALWIFGGEGYDAAGSSGLLGDMWKYDNFSVEPTPTPPTPPPPTPTPPPPEIAITNPAAASAAAVDSLSCDLSGTASTNVVGAMRWTNGLTGGSGAFPATASWSVANITVGEGNNLLTVFGSNSVGVSTSAAVTLTVPWSKPLAADYDGDRRADPAAYIGTNLYIWHSMFNYSRMGPLPYGVEGALPAASDFDGDGMADPAAYVGINWYAWLSSSGHGRVGPYAYGIAGALPVAADFDGDWIGDVAVYAGTDWTAWLSLSGYAQGGPYAYGIAGAIPAAADFDGDRRADPAVYSGTDWTAWLSGSGYAQVGPYSYGFAGAIPMAADFDGDGLGDVAVSHNRQWYAWLSSMGYVQIGPYDFNLQE